jgi:hypothetical protein
MGSVDGHMQEVALSEQRAPCNSYSIIKDPDGGV